MGFKGVGKTTLGKKIAEVKNCPFVDTDALLTKKHQKTLRELYSELGEESFRLFELEILQDLDFSSQKVVALGGGSVETGFVFPDSVVRVHLRRDKKALREQLEKDRSVFLGENDFDTMYHKREKLYKSIADYTLDMTHLSLSFILKKLSALF